AEDTVGVHMQVVDSLNLISLNTDSIDFDTTYIGSDSTISFWVENVGQDTLKVYDMPITENAFSVDTATFNLLPGTSQEVKVTFLPPSAGDYSGWIQIVSNDPVNDTMLVWVQGVGEPPVGITDPEGLPTTFGLNPNYPNPFNPATTIKYQLPQSSDVKLVIYNVLGQKVRTLLATRMKAGYHDVVWDGRNDLGAQVASGIYIYRFKAGDFLKVQKMILMK
ncbi:MAG: T9SS type A sorting domain-containing protein, partial [candidate division Zixibacteria bacterium]|nr:T9SS type A sorting domain-containing protein [Gammaproteobacteria bacterium]NIX55562.1 T9SS type A sorting domain-containing protein [candidate division Zixibacteria bacterium]